MFRFKSLPVSITSPSPVSLGPAPKPLSPLPPFRCTRRGLSISLEAVEELPDDVRLMVKKEAARSTSSVGPAKEEQQQQQQQQQIARDSRVHATLSTRERAPSDTRSMGSSVAFAWPEE